MIRSMSLAAFVAVAVLAAAGPAFAGTPEPIASKPPVLQPGTVIVAPIAPRVTQHLSGTLRFSECNAVPANVTVTVDGRSVPVVADDQGLTMRYHLDGVAAGSHTVTAVLASGVCGGFWTPRARTVEIAAGADVRDADFTYAVSRATRTIGRGTVRLLGNTVFSGFQIHLNNHDPIAAPWRASFFRSNDSFVRFSSVTPQVAFDIPETNVPYGIGPAHYYVNNVTSGPPTLDLQSDALRFTVPLHGDGSPEILGWLMNAPIRPPDVRLSNTRLEVSLRLARDASHGRVTYDKANVEFFGTISGVGVVGTFADTFDPAYHAQIAQAVRNNVQSFLERAETRETITATLQAQLATIGIGYVTSLRTTADGIVLEFRPPA